MCVEIWQTLKPSSRKQISRMENVQIHVILEYIFYEFFRSGKISTEVEKFPLFTFGMEFGNWVGPDAEKKLHPHGKCSTKNV